MLHITTEAPARMELARSSEKKKQSLKQHLLEKMKTWFNGLLEGERDEFLGRDRHVRWTKVMTTTGTAIARAESTFSVWEKSS